MESKAKPVVLIATAERWTSTARLSLALQSLGCEIALLGPGDHPAAICGAVQRRFRYDPLRPLHTLRRAIRIVQPTTLLPADEIVTGQVGELWAGLKNETDGDSGPLESLLRRSLGSAGQLLETGSRVGLFRAAQAEGIPTPETREIRAAEDLPAAFQALGTPLVLKADATSGGRGVRVVSTLEEARKTYRGFAAAPSMGRAIARGFLYRDWNHLRPSARSERRGVSAQRLVRGAERTAMALTHDGKVLALQCFEVVHTWKEHGPSSVLRRIGDERMEEAVRALVRRQHYTGFCGFDFIVDPASGVPLLLECNARPTQLAHLSFGPGRDLVAAYVREIAGLGDAYDRPSATARELIALFPQELQREPESPVFRKAFHDVPWEAPAVLYRALRGNPQLRAALIAQRRPVTRAHEQGSPLQAAP